MNLSLDKIRTDAGTQSREKIDGNVIAEYADAMKNGAKFPQIVVYHDGAEYFLADGFHRYFAARKIGSPNLDCDVREGTLRDCILFSYGANPDHGLRRTIADKRKAVTGMVSDIEWQDWSDREIAKHCNVSPTLVATIRKELGAAKKETKYSREGKEQTMRPATKRDEPAEVFDQAAIDKEMQKAASDNLQKENEDLRDQLTIAQSASSDDAIKEKAASIITDLRAQIRMLEVELRAMTNSRDQFQSENIQLMKQVAMLQKKLNKLEGK
jgi:hypothetical protein